MPYTFKGPKDCEQKSGEKGKFYTKKKGKPGRCYKSEDNYKAALAWANEVDDTNKELVEEKLLRHFIQEAIRDVLQPLDADIEDELSGIAKQYQKDSDVDKRDESLESFLSELSPEQTEDAMRTYQEIELELMGVES